MLVPIVRLLFLRRIFESVGERKMGAVVLTNGEGGVGIQTAIDTLMDKGCALDAVEAGTRVVELDPRVRSVGFGGAPNVLGEMECDASIMCGAILRTGAVGALKNYFHAISVARQVMGRTPHVMLVGEGAETFATEIGERKGNLVSEEAKFLVRSSEGNLAGGVSTSGCAYKYPGRLGDSPIIGAGLYVDNRYGAVACTHTGEMTIRAGTSRAIIAYIKKSATLEEACHEALDDLRTLKGGQLGRVVIYAIDSGGTPYVVSLGLEERIPYWFWTEEMKDMECRNASIEKM
jgi:beta-aspartyl-peptidase (threonine type)